MKIVTNRQFNEWKNKSTLYKDMYKADIEPLQQRVQDLEFKLEEVDYYVCEIIASINSETSKDSIKKKLKDLKLFIEKGKKIKDE